MLEWLFVTFPSSLSISVTLAMEWAAAASSSVAAAGPQVDRWVEG